MTAKVSMKWVFMTVVALLALWLAVVPPQPLTPTQGRILGLLLVTISLWGTGVVPNFLPSLMLFSVTLVFGLAPPDRLFAGFGSAAIWLIVSGFVIGSAIGISGLGARIAGGIGRGLGGSYPRIIIGLTGMAMVLGFLMPSSVGRAVVLMPIGMALADKAGFVAGSRGRIGIAVALTIACNMPGFAILTSNIPNMVLIGAAETVQHVRFGYTDYLLLHYPVLGLLKSAIATLLILRFYPDHVRPSDAGDGPAAAPLTAQDRANQLRVMVILGATLALWMTDSFHGINPAWIGLVAATLLLSPGIGVVPAANFKTASDFSLVIFVAGALALGTLVNESGLGVIIGKMIEAILPLAPGHDLVNFLSLAFMAAVTSLFTTAPALPSVLTPMAADLAQLTGLRLDSVLMTQVLGFSTIFLPYQVAPLVVAMQLSGEKLGNLARVILPLAAITLLVLIPLDFVWWWLTGWI